LIIPTEIEFECGSLVGDRIGLKSLRCAFEPKPLLYKAPAGTECFWPLKLIRRSQVKPPSSLFYSASSRTQPASQGASPCCADPISPFTATRRSPRSVTAIRFHLEREAAIAGLNLRFPESSDCLGEFTVSSSLFCPHPCHFPCTGVPWSPCSGEPLSAPL
jgi:hypothetical protein